ncbi:MAG: putative toxin-antitoxin system toxin component, PIN family [Clostridiales bacterium]|jgi:putative PIN family toxin of toxin-antitoxin system|nr:putative toxin-antitoxin system toxin component, PIN family [Clostridiales bacterium]
MIRVVLDTNIIVSAFWSEKGSAADILRMFAGKKILPCYNAQIMAEYKVVLSRPKLAFSRAKVGIFINSMRANGLPVSVRPSTIEFVDETDRKFYDVAKECNATLITGNTRHYPDEPLIVTPAQFLAEKN